MKKLIIFIFYVFIFLNNAQAVGEWKSFLAYNDVQQVETANNKYYVLASNNLFVYNANDNSVQTYDKNNGLNDNVIKTIGWNNVTRKLVIVYNNYNIDLLSENGNVENLPDYFLKVTTTDKTVNSVYNNGIYAYLATAFGVVRINTRNVEVSDTYQLNVNVDYCFIENNNINAAVASQGILRASMQSNLLDANNWRVAAPYIARNTTINAQTLNLVNRFRPNGPKRNQFYFITLNNGTLYGVPGIYNAAQEVLTPGEIQVWNGNSWAIFQDSIEHLTNNYVEYNALTSVTIDPTDTSHVVASGRTGVFEFRNGQFVQNYSVLNSILNSALLPYSYNYKNYTLVLTSLFDRNGNLWLLNSNNANRPQDNKPIRSLIQITRDGQWNSLHSNAFVGVDNEVLRGLTSLMFDSRNLLWFVNAHWQRPCVGFYNTSTGETTIFNTFRNQDDAFFLGETYPFCVAEDRERNIWVGTGQGPVYLDPQRISTGESTFTQVKVPRNDGTNNADYLLSGVPTTTIAVDAANRKWFGTNGAGVYVVSADNLTIENHFTTENSGLLSNTITSIAINNATGEVFFASQEGLCSYMSNATSANDGSSNNNEAFVFPNPVEPDYRGLITIRNLAFNSDVKIVSANGSVVAQGRSNGGTFTWNGNDLSGKRVAGGVYLVWSATEDGKKSVVGKIAIVN